MSVRPEGSCDPAFSAVRDAFATNFAELDEVGASVAVSVDGHMVVDLWGGAADHQGRPWVSDTLVDVFSVSKAVVALSLLLLVARGELDFEDRVSEYWPEFADHDKGDITVGQLMSHQAGLPGWRAELSDTDLYDWDTMTGALAQQEPWWQPGSAVGYHVNTLGFLGGELVARISGTPFAHFFDEHVARVLDADWHFGVPIADQARIADYYFTTGEADPAASPVRDRDDVYRNPPGASGLGTVNTRAWRSAVHPSTNGHAHARAIARVYTPLANGGRSARGFFLDPGVLSRATQEFSRGHDLILDRPSRFGFGFQLTFPERPLGPGAHSFGHFGAGGSLGMADPDAQVAIGYCMNRFGLRWRDPRNQALLDAIYDAL